MPPYLETLRLQWEQERSDYALLQSLFKETGVTKKYFAQLCGMTDRMLRYKLSPACSKYTLTFSEWYLLRALREISKGGGE